MGFVLVDDFCGYCKDLKALGFMGIYGKWNN